MMKRTINKFPSRLQRFLFFIGLSLLVLTVLLVTPKCSSDAKQPAALLEVKKGNFEVTIPGFGEMQAVKSTPISVPVQARGQQTIAWIAPENSFVKEGETVIRLDDNVYKERIQTEQFQITRLNLEIEDKASQMDKEKSELQGQLKITAIEKDLADVYAARDESLFPRNKIIEDKINLEYLEEKNTHYRVKQSKLDQKVKAEMQLLELRRRTHQVQLDQYKEALKSLEITAPHNGLFIYEKNWRGEKPRIGMTVWAGRKIGKLPDLGIMEAKVFILESEAAGLKADLPVEVVLDSDPDKVFKGKVTNIDTIAKPLEQESPLKYFEVKVALEKTVKEIMKPGNQVKVLIFVQQLNDVLSVPNQALFFEHVEGKDEAFVNLKSSSGFEKQKVVIGARSLTRTVITEGLEEGRKILLGKAEERD